MTSTTTDESEQGRLATLGSASFLAYLLLLGEPFGMAFGQVMMRKLRNLSNMTVSCYTNLSSLLIFSTAILITGDDVTAY